MAQINEQIDNQALVVTVLDFNIQTINRNYNNSHK